MKRRTLTRITLTTLFAALAIPVRVTAQGQPTPPQDQKATQHYTLIDLGTFGGPMSYLPGPPPVFRVLNSHWTVIAAADTSISDPNSPNCFNSDCFVSHGLQWRNGVRTDLGALPGINSSLPLWINDRGLIAGFSQNGLIDPVTGFPAIEAVLWKDGQIINLGTVGGGYESAANAVNDHGQVAGWATNNIPDPFSEVGQGTQSRAILWENGVPRDLGTLGGPDALAELVNEHGQVAGQSYTNGTPNPVTGVPTQDPFLWTGGEMLDLGGLGGSAGETSDLNNRGQVVGISNLPGDLTFHPFLWDGGVMTDLGTLGGNTGYAVALNDHREVAGYADLPGSTTHHAFLWKNGKMKDLGVLAGNSCSAAWFINSKGQMVGHSHDCSANSSAVLWENGGPPINLNTRIPSGSALQLLDAFNINDGGEIAGYGVLANGDQHAYLLIPCDGSQPDTKGCAGTPEITAAMTQRSPAPVAQANPAVSDQPSGTLGALRARMAHRYHVPGTAARAE